MKKAKLITNGQIGNLIIDGIDISKHVTSYKITQEGGSRPKVTIECRPEDLKMLLNDLKEIKVKVIK